MIPRLIAAGLWLVGLLLLSRERDRTKLDEHDLVSFVILPLGLFLVGLILAIVSVVQEIGKRKRG